MSIVTTLLALLIEAAVGYPDWLFRRIRHPAVWIGGLIGLSDKAFNREGWSGVRRRFAGLLSLFLFVGIPTTVAWGVEQALVLVPFGILFVGILASTLIAQTAAQPKTRFVGVFFPHGMAPGQWEP